MTEDTAQPEEAPEAEDKTAPYETSPPTAAPRRACLVIIQGRALGQIQVLSDQALVLGRAPDADLRLEDVGVSRHHVRLEPVEHGWTVHDQRSRNGLFVNGRRVT